MNGLARTRGRAGARPDRRIAIARGARIGLALGLGLGLGPGLGLVAGAAGAQVQTGIAAAYPGDVGLGNDARVVFFEDFEAGTASELSRRWEQVVTGAGIQLPSDAPADAVGRRSVELSVRGGASETSQLYTRLPSALDTVFVRYYVKYVTPPSTQSHSSLWIGGYNPSTAWPQGGAGIRPSGNDRFFLTYQPYGANRMDFYAYWMGMSGLPDGYFWGNSFLQDPSLKPAYDRWTCIEIMLKGNQPVTSANGELALWVDGVPIMHMGQGFPNGYDQYGAFTPNPSGPPWRGFQWRSTSALKANFVWLSLYEPSLASGATSRLRFDQVAVATQYIGPILREVPEPGIALGLFVGSFASAGLARRDGRGRRARVSDAERFSGPRARRGAPAPAGARRPAPGPEPRAGRRSGA